MISYLDFQLILYDWKPSNSNALSGHYKIIVISETGEPEMPSEVYLDWNIIRPLLASFKGKKLSEEKANELRQYLAKLLLPEKISFALRQAEALAKERKQKIRIRLDILDERLTSIPWELSQLNDDYSLGFDPRYSIVRHSRSLNSWRSSREDSSSTRFLFVSADNITNFSILNADIHIDMLKNQITTYNSKPNTIEAKAIPNVTLDILLEELEHQWDIVHFAGHGVITDTGPRLVLCDSKEKSIPNYVAVESILPKLISSNVKIVNLLACHGGQSVINGQPNGIAGVLSRQGIPAVLSMQDAIQPGHAFKQSATIYRHLINGADLEHSVILGRLSSLQDDEINHEWSIPILHFQYTGEPFFIKEDSLYASRLVSRFHDVLLKDKTTLIELTNHFKNDVEVNIDKLTLTGKSVGIKL